MRDRVAEQLGDCPVCRAAELAELLGLAGPVPIAKRGPRPRDPVTGDPRARALARLAGRHPLEFLELLGDEEDRQAQPAAQT